LWNCAEAFTKETHRRSNVLGASWARALSESKQAAARHIDTKIVVINVNSSKHFGDWELDARLAHERVVRAPDGHPQPQLDVVEHDGDTTVGIHSVIAFDIGA
jgi:hypothetical protein